MNADQPSSCPVKSLIQSVGRHRQRRKAERPHELLEAALTLFTDKGFAGTRMEEVAKLAGVSKGTLYLYYPSKEELFKAVVRNYLTAVIRESHDIIDSYDGHTGDLIRALALNWWERVGSGKASGLLLPILNEAHHFPDIVQFYVEEVVKPSHTLIIAALDRGVARREFREVDTQSVVHAMIAPIQYLVLHRHCEAVCSISPTPLEPMQFLAAQMELLLHGLLRQQPATP